MTGEELRRERRKLGLSQKRLGEELGLHENSIARMERDELPVVRTTELAVKYLVLVMNKKVRREK